MQIRSRIAVWAMRAAIASSASIFPSVALAQSGSCSDILRSGVFDSYVSKHTDVYHEIVISRFLSSSFDDSKNVNLGVSGKSLGELVMGSGYSQSDFTKKQSSMRNEYTRDITHDQEWQLAVSTGDHEIISAWQGCMNNRKGLYARFESQPLSPREAILIIEFFGNPSDTTKLSQDVYLPDGFKAPMKSQVKKCLSRGAKLTSDVACQVNVHFSSAATSGSVVVQAPNGSANAYVAPRLVWKRVEKPFSARIDMGAKPNDSATIPFSFAVDPALINDGFTLKIDSVGSQFGVSFGGGHGGNCSGLQLRPTVFGVSGTYQANASSAVTLGCALVVTATLERERLELVRDQ